MLPELVYEGTTYVLTGMLVVEFLMGVMVGILLTRR